VSGPIRAWAAPAAGATPSLLYQALGPCNVLTIIVCNTTNGTINWGLQLMLTATSSSAAMYNMQPLKAMATAVLTTPIGLLGGDLINALTDTAGVNFFIFGVSDP